MIRRWKKKKRMGFDVGLRFKTNPVAMVAIEAVAAEIVVVVVVVVTLQIHI